MPVEVSSQFFVTIARTAHHTGGTLKMDANRRYPMVTNGGFLGRKVAWLKKHIVPNRVRAQNRSVLNAYSDALDKDLTFPYKVNLTLPRVSSSKIISEKILAIDHDVQDEFGETALAEIVDRARQRGYIRDILPADEFPLPCAGPMVNMPDKEFKHPLYNFIKLMDDFHAHFPALKNIDPPSFCQIDLRIATNDTKLGLYNLIGGVFAVKNNSPSEWHEEYTARQAKNSSGHRFNTPAKNGVQGVMSHEYAHHLSLTVVKEDTWHDSLVQTLKDNKVMPLDKGRIYKDKGVFVFDTDTRENIKAHYGTYAASKVIEFMAETLSWYMSQECDSSIKDKVPKYMQQWIQNSFPFLKTSHGTEPG